MRIKFWGTRGSTSSPSASTVRYGGNTSCLSITTYSGQELILDAGSGMRALGQDMVAGAKKVKCSLLLSHFHFDHIQGLPFFAPLYKEDHSVAIYGPALGKPEAKQNIQALITKPFCPVEFDDLPAKTTFTDFTPGDSFSIEDIWVETAPTMHTMPCSAFRVTADNWSIAYCVDHEGILANAKASQEHIDICNGIEKLITGADVAIVDAQYTDEEYHLFQGEGHSCYGMWVELALRAGIKYLYFTHHAPDRTDSELEQILANLRHQYSHLPISLHIASEGSNLIYPGKITQSKKSEHFLEHVNRFTQTLSSYKDVNTILDLILKEARSLTNAEAGAFYLYDKEKNSLQFSFAHNEKLHSHSTNQHVYSRIEIPLNTDSVCGYVGLTKNMVNLADVHMPPKGLAFKYQDDFDKASGYHTTSMLAVPFCALGNELVAVLSLVNKKHDDKTIPFNSEDELTLQALGTHAVAAIERAHMTRELLVRMLSMAALHDPVETGNHIQRVGAYAAEIFVAWARKRGMAEDRLFRIKDQIHTAAMLHDIGKIGISDVILKKKAKLTPSEFKEMEKHCYLGASLFNDAQLGIDEMARQIALHHHQRWDGKGYTGHPNIPLLSGEDIPIPARITIVADVLDALCTTRFAKEAFSLEKAMKQIIIESGTRFDPSIVESLAEITDVIRAIQIKYSDDNYSVIIPINQLI